MCLSANPSNVGLPACAEWRSLRAGKVAARGRCCGCWQLTPLLLLLEALGSRHQRRVAHEAAVPSVSGGGDAIHLQKAEAA